MPKKPFIIDDATPVDELFLRPRGLVPRDYSTEPQPMFAPPSEIKLIPRSEWSARIKEQDERESSLEHIFKRLKAANGISVPFLHQNGHGYCFPAGTRVRMADGTQKKIEDVVTLDQVLTAEGNVRRVMQCHVRDHVGDMINLKLYGHGYLRLTPNHSVLTKRGYVRAEHLTKNDWVCLPRYSPRTVKVVQTADHVKGLKRRLARVNGQETWETRMPAEGDLGYVKIPDFIELTEGAGRIFGLWLAEGHVSGGEVAWSFNVNETDTLAAELVELLETEWGAIARIEPGPASPSVVQVILGGTLWAQLFVSLCGKLAGGKRVHRDLMCGPQEFHRGLFSGWMDGDGTERNPNKKRGYDHEYLMGATVSHDLALNMFDIAAGIGYNPTIGVEKGKPSGVVKSRQDAWKVQVIPNPSDYRPNFRLRSEKDRAWRRVRGIRRESFVGVVYNIGVEGDNSYVAEGVGVHNCWAYSVGNALMLRRAAENQPYIRLNPHAVAAIIKRGADQGGWCGLSAKFYEESGCPTEAFWKVHSRDVGQDTAEMRANAALHKVTESFIDITASIYDRMLSEDQRATLLLNNIPLACDYNEWGHSVCAGRLVEVEPGYFKERIMNSWLGWGDDGWGTIARSWSVDSSVGLRVTGATTK